MNIVTIAGSPKKNGKTAQTLDLLEANLLSKGHNVERISVTDYQIRGCNGCLACQKVSDRTGCVITGDDVSAILDRLISADAV